MKKMQITYSEFRHILEILCVHIFRFTILFVISSVNISFYKGKKSIKVQGEAGSTRKKIKCANTNSLIILPMKGKVEEIIYCYWK